jgi:hypothetical protein
MPTARKPEKEPKPYLPDEVLLNYMQEKLQFEIKYIKEDLRGRTSDPDYELLNKRKNDVLKKIFKSMANLIFFFECIANLPSSTMPSVDKVEREARKVIRELFQNDVKDLLGIRRSAKDKRQTYAFLFDRLIHSLIYTGDGKVDEGNQFRLKLIHILQDSIYRKVPVTLSDDFSQGGKGIVLNDIGRAAAWTEMLAKKVDTKEGTPSNTINFPRPFVFNHERFLI